jgi:hypothetical protein
MLGLWVRKERNGKKIMMQTIGNTIKLRFLVINEIFE